MDLLCIRIGINKNRAFLMFLKHRTSFSPKINLAYDQVNHMLFMT